MQVPVPTQGTVLREMVTREESEDHPWFAASLVHGKRAFAEPKTRDGSRSFSFSHKPLSGLCFPLNTDSGRPLSVVTAQADKCITMHIDCSRMPQQKSARNRAEIDFPID
jgi:hypothetical protein